MIFFKLDHISYVMQKDKVDKILVKDIVFSEKELHNPIGKKIFMKKDNGFADLYFNRGVPNIEYIVYEQVDIKSSLSWDGQIFYGAFSSYDKAIRQLNCIGLTVEDNINRNNIIVKNKGLLDVQPFVMHLEYNDNVNDIVYLDAEGWNCPCFVIDSVSRMVESLDTDLFDLAGVDKITINGKQMEVTFIKAKNINIIFEFISMEREVVIEKI